METQDFSFDIKSLGETGLIEGVASAYGNVDLQGDIVAAGAFAKSLAEGQAAGRRPAMLLHHDMARPVGRWDSFAEDPKGLLVKGQLALGTPDADTAYALLKAKALAGLSVGFTGAVRALRRDGVRTIKSANLIEISLVSVPANPDARVRRVKAISNAADIEALLRTTGLSGRKAKAAASAAWATIGESRDDAEAMARIKSVFDRSTSAIARITGV